MTKDTILSAIMTIAFLAMPVSMFWYLIAMMSSKYINKKHPDYYKLTMGNPMNALHQKQLRTPLGEQKIPELFSSVVMIWLISFSTCLVCGYLYKYN